MPIKIGSKWLENLCDVRAEVLKTSQGHSLEAFPVFILRQDNLCFYLFPSDKATCYECRERIKRNGFEFRIMEFNEKDETQQETLATFYFHYEHFRRLTKPA